MYVVRIAFIVKAVPGVEKIADILGTFRPFAPDPAFGYRFAGVLVLVSVLALFFLVVGFGFPRLLRRNILKKCINPAGRHQRIRDSRFIDSKVRLDDRFDLGNDLTVKRPGIVVRTAAESDLEQQFERNLAHWNIENVRAVFANDRSHQIEIFPQAPIGATQTVIDARVFHRAKDLARQARFGKNI